MRGAFFGLLAACFIAGASVTDAQAQGSVQAVCPLDGERFAYTPPAKSTTRQTYLDQRPIEPEAPWSLAKCPRSGFVVYKPQFSASELERLRAYVGGEEYRKLSAAHSTYYLEAALRRHLGEPAYDVAYALLQATWEVTGDAARYKQYATEALAAYDAIALDSLPNLRNRIFKRMISGELARRLGDFASARDRLLEMRDNPEMESPFLQRIIARQLRLVRDKDSGRHRIPLS